MKIKKITISNRRYFYDPSSGSIFAPRTAKKKEALPMHLFTVKEFLQLRKQVR